MQRLLGLFVTCLISGAMAFGQGVVNEQSPVTSGIQPKTLHTNPNGNGTVSRAAQGGNVPKPSTPNQELPSNSNPANAATGGRANGQAIRPNSSQDGIPGTSAGNAPTGRDNSGRIRRNGVGRNPVNGSTQAPPTTNRRTFSEGKWLWTGLAFVVGLVLIGVLACSRRVREERDSRVFSSRIATIRSDEQRPDDQIRKAG
jgi:hypothetical protein